MAFLSSSFQLFSGSSYKPVETKGSGPRKRAGGELTSATRCVWSELLERKPFASLRCRPSCFECTLNRWSMNEILLMRQYAWMLQMKVVLWSNKIAKLSKSRRVTWRQKVTYKLVKNRRIGLTILTWKCRSSTKNSAVANIMQKGTNYGTMYTMFKDSNVAVWFVTHQPHRNT